MGKLIDGRKIAAKINAATAKRVRKLKSVGVVPKLAVFLVGDDLASAAYVRQKAKVAAMVGVNFVLRKFPAGISAEELKAEIETTQNDPQLSGLVVQLPLPEHLWEMNVLDAISPDLDVDFLNKENRESLGQGKNTIEPPAPGAVLAILRELKINPVGKKITIVGAGALVGRPLAAILSYRGADVTSCNSKTLNIEEKCREADVLISCVGKRNLIRSNMVKKGAVVIDAGFSFYRGKSYGDVDVAGALKKASFVTPTPGGVGPVTVAVLLSSAVALAEKKCGSK